MRKRAASLFLAFWMAVSLLPGHASAAELENEAVKRNARIPISQVQARLKNGTDYLDKFGVTREKIVRELSAHEHDNYYLNTPFVGGDWQSPRGDTSYNGAPGTNCAGFVAYVLRKCGLDTAAVLKTMRSSSRFTRWGSGLPYDGLSSASNYMSLAERGKIISYAYPTKAAMLKDGKCEKGDIILRFWTDSWGGYDEDNHLMIFWGSTPQEDKVWQNASGRLHIGQMWCGDASSFIVIKFAPSKPPAPPVAGFQDVREDQWYAEAVRYVKENGLMAGTKADRFSPNSPATRAQIVSILWRLSGEPEAWTKSCFTDVKEGQYYSTAVDWAVESGIVSGFGDDTFRPGHTISRQDLAVILYRYCQYRGADLTVEADLSGYADASEISGYALEAMGWANAAGLITGTTEETLLPAGGASRCQTASILMRLRENVMEKQQNEE